MQAILGSLSGLLIWLVMASGLYVWLQHGATAIQIAGAANQAQVIGAALGRYVKDHGAQLATVATPMQPANVLFSDLKTNGYLPSGMGTSNVFGQQWVAQVLQPQPGQLQTILFSSGGRAIPPDRLVPLASQSSGRGNLGGFVPYANQAGDATMQPGFAIGAGGTFRQSLTGYANPGSGHLAMLVGVADTQSDSGYLYRVDMKPARPELNNMQTDFGLTGTDGVQHSINGADTVNANAFRLSNGASLNGDQGGALELGDVAGNHPGQSPYIDLHYGGQGAQDYNIRVMNDANNRLSVYSANGQATFAVQGAIQPGNLATPGGGCPSNGAMEANADGSGQPVACMYGKWTPIGGSKQWNGFASVANGSFVAAPTCPSGGTAEIVTVPNSFNVDATAIVNYVTAGNGRGWTVSIVDGNQSPVSGSGSALTYCAYQ
ncbi:shufflon system plasmid conjugative transfer pilus tip adhesin PilV [Paraburkholderia megapolitana]|uniref:shufflon system plasmid conjugative transfer pilus tip adhesin PilV n=1 Tax=Paraburkholderia megapolitana TaxID=420953 RepID=UPI0038BB497C